MNKAINDLKTLLDSEQLEKAHTALETAINEDPFSYDLLGLMVQCKNKMGEIGEVQKLLSFLEFLTNREIRDGVNAKPLKLSSMISVHIPRCGGTSFRQVLQTLYGVMLHCDYGEEENRRFGWSLSPKSYTRCIHGHFCADKYDVLFPSSLRITWVRHPVQRVISQYYYCLRHPDESSFTQEVNNRKLSLIEFASIDKEQNIMTRYFAGKKVSDFQFVGIVEFYEASLKLFHKITGLPFQWIPHFNKNTNRSNASYEISEAEMDEIMTLNSSDIALYQTALDIFHSSN